MTLLISKPFPLLHMAIDDYCLAIYDWGMAGLLENLEQKAKALGFNMVGVVTAVPSPNLNAYLRWIEAEMHGQMGYLARPDRLARRQDLNVILPNVQTIICVGLEYSTVPVPPAIANDPSRGRISNYAWQADYHDVMTPRLEELAAWLKTQKSGSDVATKVYVDTGAVLERDHAAAAGLGFTGKNTMLIAPKRGSFFFLGEILTTLEIRDWRLGTESTSNLQSPISQMPTCGSCRRCLDACPTDAFPEPYVLDARRCISYLTIELKGWIPRELRPFMHNWVYGCDICQVACPFNRFSAPTKEIAFYPQGDWKSEIGDFDGSQSPISNLQSPLWNTVAPPLLELLTLGDASFAERFARSPIKRIKRTRLVRNACVAAGNWGSETAVPALINLLTDPEPIIRGHAVWALQQIGGEVALGALAELRDVEENTAVLQELQ
ncbi:tRNA epoxyqueuosine(34) reductase QueG [Candidatus Leptofilum sp.]|uniref:tRNA epoxyqueuosine(34) reductase QueG n=1 Tax=Candidatus Leptofilum sp. TaxID=3241576 RepID=UPI003B5CC66C